MRTKNLIGEVFGRLTVVALSHITKKSVYWKCVCICGKVTSVRADHLRNKGIMSCGCLRREIGPKNPTVHNESGKNSTAEYRLWQNIKKRCFDAKYKAWPDYGGRGIKMYGSWIDSYERFRDGLIGLIGRRPDSRYSIDRIDVNGNYEPGNIRWATAKEQAYNKRRYQ